jgi:hypothetical protein
MADPVHLDGWMWEEGIAANDEGCFLLPGNAITKVPKVDATRMVRLFALGMLLSLVAPTDALAQKRIPKAKGHNQCPLGYVNTLGTTCVSPIYYEMRATNGEACLSGWMNVGAGYCRKK